jgi:hypothetical protein
VSQLVDEYQDAKNEQERQDGQNCTF